MSLSLLNLEEQQHKDEIVSLTEEVLDAKGIECDSKITKISEEQLREILKYLAGKDMETWAANKKNNE